MSWLMLKEMRSHVPFAAAMVPSPVLSLELPSTGEVCFIRSFMRIVLARRHGLHAHGGRRSVRRCVPSRCHGAPAERPLEGLRRLREAAAAGRCAPQSIRRVKLNFS